MLLFRKRNSKNEEEINLVFSCIESVNNFSISSGSWTLWVRTAAANRISNEIGTVERLEERRDVKDMRRPS